MIRHVAPNDEVQTWDGVGWKRKLPDANWEMHG
jgi:hypothetical protein